MENYNSLPLEIKTQIINLSDKSTFNSLSKLNKETNELIYSSSSFSKKKILEHVNPLDLYSYRLVIIDKHIDQFNDDIDDMDSGHINIKLIFEILGMEISSMNLCIYPNWYSYIRYWFDDKSQLKFKYNNNSYFSLPESSEFVHESKNNKYYLNCKGENNHLHINMNKKMFVNLLTDIHNLYTNLIQEIKNTNKDNN